METIKVKIQATKNHFDAFATNVDGIFGAGASLSECKQSIQTAIDLLIEYNEQNGYNLPQWLIDRDYSIEYDLDTQSLLTFYLGTITRTGLSRITGINEKQLLHYASGLSKPRAPQKDKIIKGFHTLGAELIAL